MKKLIELCKVRQGEVFTLDSVDFVKLADAHGGVFALTRNVGLKNVPFEEKGINRYGHNNFEGSSIEQAMAHWLRTEHRKIFDVSMPTCIDLTTMDGMTDYGCPAALARALTIDDYRKYRKFIPLTREAYWLATGYTTDSSPYSSSCVACGVYPDGTLGYCNVYDACFKSRPALYLTPATIVSVGDGEKETGITGFTDTELIEELYKRRKKIKEGAQ